MSITTDVLTAEVTDLIKEFNRMFELAKHAKTNAKRNHFTKKYKKLNNDIADMLIALDKVAKADEERQAPKQLSYERQ